MVRRLVLGLLWLACVHADTSNNMPMKEASMLGSENDASTGIMAPLAKAKRYLSHQHSSPCPPFYPHFGMHMPMYAMRPYGPPAYPKHDIPMYHDHHQHHQPIQYIHQPSYNAYAPKIHAPMYHHQIQNHAQPNYHHLHLPMVHPKVSYEKQPVFAYAPAYHKPMPMIWKAPEIKPAIVYKPHVPKCAPCPPTHQSYHHPPQPTISYIKVAQPIHRPMVEPCDK